MRTVIPFVLLVCCGCHAISFGAKPVVLPSIAQITSIEVTPKSIESRATSVITKPEQIDRFVSFINSRQDNWKSTWHTFPSGWYTVAVKQDDELIAVFWPASGFIGGRGRNQGADSNRLRSLSTQEWTELCSILEISPDSPRP